MVLNIAHRGGADLWPENTMAAFAGAIACGADGAELDVHLSKDGEVVVFHDERLKPEIVRGPDGAWREIPGPRLKDLTFSELQAYDVGRLKPGTRYAAAHPAQQPSDGERIPRLADVIDLARARSDRFQLWIELKTDLRHAENGADPVALADAALAVVLDTGFAARTVFVSFDWRSLRRIRQQTPAIPTYATTLPQAWFGTGVPTKEDGAPPAPELAWWRAAIAAGASWEAGFNARDFPSIQQAVAALGADGWFSFYRDITRESAAAARALGLGLAAWTVPKRHVENLISLGVGAICTDDPTILSNRIL